MSENTLVINCGSSSLKFAVFDTARHDCLLKGVAEPLGGAKPRLKWTQDGRTVEDFLHAGATLEDALHAIAERLLAGIEIQSIGHRVVHGAEKFKASAVIDEAMMEQVEACNHLAPLHNPANLTGIRMARKVFGDIPHVGVFDTAFHQSIPREAYLYALPYEFYEELGVRRYGFHGTSHHYVYREAARRLGKPLQSTSILSAHLGNGSSATAAQAGKSMDTTMGLTPLEGLVMGTRCGDIDPSIHGFLCREKGYSIEEVDAILNKKSGLLGLSGLSNDMRELVDAAEKGHERSQIALDVLVFRLAKSLAALRTSLDHCDAIVFTGGIGEHNPWLREAVVRRLGFLGVQVDPVANATHGGESDGRISPPDSPVAVYVIPTNEELMIAMETAETLRAR
ncbi:MAG: acetate kinase [Puniceicoccaceae bacterium]